MSYPSIIHIPYIIIMAHGIYGYGGYDLRANISI